MTSTYLYSKLNQYFEKDIDINKCIKFKRDNIYPEELDTEEKKKKYRNKYKKFIVVDNKLVYEPNNLIVIPKRSINKTLKDMYKNVFGAGIVNFYKTIRTKYLNINSNN
jgi:hypothetical protein